MGKLIVVEMMFAGIVKIDEAALITSCVIHPSTVNKYCRAASLKLGRLAHHCKKPILTRHLVKKQVSNFQYNTGNETGVTKVPIDILPVNCWHLHWEKLELNQSSCIKLDQILLLSVCMTAFQRKIVYQHFCPANDQQKTGGYICSVDPFALFNKSDI